MSELDRPHELDDPGAQPASRPPGEEEPPQPVDVRPRSEAEGGPRGIGRLAWWWRAAWTLVSLFVVETFVFGLSVLPAILVWDTHYEWAFDPEWLQSVLVALWFVPSYLVFALAFMALSALAMRLLGWRTPASMEMRIADLPWPLLDWARYVVSTHLVRVFVGTFFRATPVWTVFLRLNGARTGRRVYVNSLDVSDHCLLEFDDDVVVGADVHMSGHTVEGGVVKTGTVRLGRNVTIGVGCVIGIDVEVGDDTQIGALSFVPKRSRLDADSVYVGIPVRKMDRPGPT